MSSAAILFLSLFAFLTAEPQAVVKPDRLVTISVRVDPVLGVPAQTIEIVTDPPIRNITSADLHNRVWTATRVIGSQAATINSNSCPQLRTVALSFSDLPAIPIRPLASLVAESRPIGPTMKDGYSTSLAFDTLASDFGLVTVRLDGWGPYHQWGHEAVSQLQSCWPT